MGHVVLLNWSLLSARWSLVKCIAMRSIQTCYAELKFAKEAEGEALPNLLMCKKNMQWQSTGHSEMQTKWQSTKNVVLICFYFLLLNKKIQEKMPVYPWAVNRQSFLISWLWSKRTSFGTVTEGLWLGGNTKENDKEGELINLEVKQKLRWRGEHSIIWIQY